MEPIFNNQLSGFPISHFMRDESDAGNINAIKDYSVTPALFEIQAGSDGVGAPVIAVCSLVIHFVASATSSLRSNTYGGGNNGTLTNGIRLLFTDKDNNVLVDFTHESPIKTNAGWAQYNYQATEYDYGGGFPHFGSLWNTALFGRPAVLRNGQKLCLELSDDFTGQAMSQQTFLAAGYIP